MEVIGLAIVIAILIVGLLFVVKFIVLKEPVEYKKSYTQTELASNMLNTFLKTTSRDCYKLSMTELLQDCAQIASITCENGLSSCNYVEETANYLFSETLGNWNLRYYFSAFFEAGSDLIQSGNECQYKADKKSKLFPVPTAAGVLSVKLDICG